MDIFNLRNNLVGEYGQYARGFIKINLESLRDKVTKEMDAGALWPDPLLQLNPCYELSGTVEDLVDAKIAFRVCKDIL